MGLPRDRSGPSAVSRLYGRLAAAGYGPFEDDLESILGRCETAESMTSAVLVAEGLDPQYCEKRLRRQIEALVLAYIAEVADGDDGGSA